MVEHGFVTKKNLGHMLLESNLIDEVQMKVALAEQRRTGKRFGSTLVDLKFIDENVLAAFLSKQYDVPCISLLNVHVPRLLIRQFPFWLASRTSAVPVAMKGDSLEVAMADPMDQEAVGLIRETIGREIVPLIAPQSSITKMLVTLYPQASGAPDDTLAIDTGRDSINDPIFRELIEELDVDGRLERIETRLDEIWTILEKVLRRVEEMKPAARQTTDVK